jgi:hypothetical protein
MALALLGALLSAVLISGCPDGERLSTADQVKYGDCDVPRYFVAHCSGSACHTPVDGEVAGHVDLISTGFEKRIIGQLSDPGPKNAPCPGEPTLLVVPENPEASYLLEKLHPSPRCGAEMPPTSKEYATQGDLICVTQWIAGLGAEGGAGGGAGAGGVAGHGGSAP